MRSACMSDNNNKSDAQTPPPLPSTTNLPGLRRGVELYMDCVRICILFFSTRETMAVELF